MIKRVEGFLLKQLQSCDNSIAGAERQIESLKVYLANQKAERDAVAKDLLEFQKLCKK